MTPLRFLSCLGIAIIGAGLVLAAPTMLVLGAGFMGLGVVGQAASDAARKPLPEVTAGGNEPDPGEFEDWDISHDFADGSVAAGRIAQARRGYRTGKLDHFAYEQHLDYVLLSGEHYAKVWGDELPDLYKTRAVKRRATPGAVLKSDTTMSAKSREAARRRLSAEYERASNPSAVMVLDEGMKIEPIKPPKPVYIERWHADGHKVVLNAQDIAFATEVGPGAWTYTLKDTKLAPMTLYKERPPQPEDHIEAAATAVLNAQGKTTERQRVEAERLARAKEGAAWRAQYRRKLAREAALNDSNPFTRKR